MTRHGLVCSAAEVKVSEMKARMKAHTMEFSLSSTGNSSEFLVMGCNLPVATPRAISTSRSLYVRFSVLRGTTLQCKSAFHRSMSLLVRSTLPNTLFQGKRRVGV